MAESSLEEALKDHGSSFSGLLSLIPAKVYYGEGQTNPYGKVKKSKSEKAEAKRAKLNPDSIANRTAQEELEARASNKRKRRRSEVEEQSNAVPASVDESEPDDAGSDGEISIVNGVEMEAPLDVKIKPGEEAPRKKKQKTSTKRAGEEEGKTEKGDKQLRREAKREAKKERQRQRKLDKKAANGPTAAAGAGTAESPGDEADPFVEKGVEQVTESKMAKAEKKEKKKRPQKDAKPTLLEPSSDGTAAAAEVPSRPSKAAKPTVKSSQAEPDTSSHVEASASEELAGPSNASSLASEPMSPTFDSEVTRKTATNPDPVSGTTSVSSVVPLSEKPKQITLPENMDDFRERFKARLEALRAARKAPGTGERPARSRQELMEQRRKKEAERKANKKEVRRLAKLEEDRKREEALAANSPLNMSPLAELDDAEPAAQSANLSFGRVTFNDDTQLSHDLSYELTKGKKKGPSDPKTALLRLQNQKKRLDGMDGEKRADVEDKEAWLTARRRAEGDRSIKDDEALLRKAVKRKDREKRKSDRAWDERAKGVEKAQAAKQKKREDNLQKRKDEKTMRKIGGKKKVGAAGKPGKNNKRTGFERSGGLNGVKSRKPAARK